MGSAGQPGMQGMDGTGGVCLARHTLISGIHAHVVHCAAWLTYHTQTEHARATLLRRTFAEEMRNGSNTAGDLSPFRHWLDRGLAQRWLLGRVKRRDTSANMLLVCRCLRKKQEAIVGYADTVDTWPMHIILYDLIFSFPIPIRFICKAYRITF